jgi:alanine racemase
MTYTLHQKSQLTSGTIVGNNDASVSTLLTDSRKLNFPESVMFIAIRGATDGHKFIPQLLERGVKTFLVEYWQPNLKIPDDAGYIIVPDTVKAFQKIAEEHRKKFFIPIVGITGSNGKTIVKEWLNQCLQSDYNVTRSPKSYNSQIGVPLSIWELSEQTEIGIFEAGISLPNEMENLANIIKPTIGILTNIGDAHQENFKNLQQKLLEKAKLFACSTTVIMSSEDENTMDTVKTLYKDKKIVTYGYKSSDNIKIISKNTDSQKIEVDLIYKNKNQLFTIPFIDTASFQNAMSVISFLFELGYNSQTIQQRIIQLSGIDMRLEMKEGKHSCTLVNDSYNSDLVSLQSSLEYLYAQKQHSQKTVIMSDIHQSGLSPDVLYGKVSDFINFYSPDRFIGVGNQLTKYSKLFKCNSLFFHTTNELLNYLEIEPPKNVIILLKGSRSFRFERIDRQLQYKQHRTVMEINLSALISNFRNFRSKLNPNTKTIIMLKAFGYGNGSFELASVLQYHLADYIAVAFTDEAVNLRERGITMPIIVMNPDIDSIPEIVDYNLEPEIFGFDFLEAFNSYLQKQSISRYAVHIKIDTGMKRNCTRFCNCPD